ncbi:TMEM175 family protein [Halorarius halobius]|uniref:TMEM175 family protein n=1 Tax=Halorarius halobius TaxID=2962671 RepID=UPI0020CD3E16|nr:TMEM175 family protein [Halorarius halobius]
MALSFQREAAETDRLLALSDGVIAIAITLLVLEITVPEAPLGTETARIQAVVFDQWVPFVGYVVGFLVVGNYWILHRRVFVHIEEHDQGVLWLNLLFLLFVAFVPYGASVFSTYPDQLGVSFIAALLALTGLSLAVLWLYASRKRLLEAGLTSRLVGIQAARFLASPIVFLLSIVVAAVDPSWAMLSWLLLVPITATLNSRLVESIETADGASP